MEKTLEIQLHDLRESIAQDIENQLEIMMPPVDSIEIAVYEALTWAAAVARGKA